MNRVLTRQRLCQILAGDDTDRAIDAAVRSFWARSKALPVARSSGAEVVDLARWAERRGRTTP